MEDIKFERVGRGELRSFRLSALPKFGKTGVDGITIVWRTGVLGPEVFPTEVVSKGSFLLPFS